MLDDLRKSNSITQGYKYTKASASNVISAIRQWLFFTNFFLVPVLPASVDSVVCFVEFMARTSGYEHLKHLLSSLRFLHQALDLKFPEQNFQIDMTMQGLKRRLARVPFQVLPITPQILRDIYNFLDLRKLSDLALWCAFLISFYSLLTQRFVTKRYPLLTRTNWLRPCPDQAWTRRAHYPLRYFALAW